MKWNEVTVATASEAVEAVANILMEHGASGVAIEDVLDIENFKSDAYGEILDKETYTTLEEGAQVSAYFPETIFLPEALPTIKAAIDRLPEYGLAIGKNTITTSEVVEEAWANGLEKILPSSPYLPLSDDRAELGKLSTAARRGKDHHP